MAVRCGVLPRLRLRGPAFGVGVPAFRVGVAPFLLMCPALVPALRLDLLPDNRVVLCADKGVAPPVGWAKDLQQLALDGIDVLQPLFQGCVCLCPVLMMTTSPAAVFSGPFQVTPAKRIPCAGRDRL